MYVAFIGSILNQLVFLCVEKNNNEWDDAIWTRRKRIHWKMKWNGKETNKVYTLFN